MHQTAPLGLAISQLGTPFLSQKKKNKKKSTWSKEKKTTRDHAYVLREFIETITFFLKKVPEATLAMQLSK